MGTAKGCQPHDNVMESAMQHCNSYIGARMTPQFWSRLRWFESENVFNPWADLDPLDLSYTPARDRCERLKAHFDVDAKYLLIGEAPGYRGCHFSGVPFTCEKQIAAGIVPRVTAERITKRDLPWSEGSATVIWSSLYELGIANETVMWNAFFAHPHLPGDTMSNRTPTRDELLCGMDILAMVVEAFPGAKRIAVGKTAARTLQGLNFRIDHEVRHPSMGGANQFRAQMRELVSPAVAA
jgi:uracil-DNA glycosylase